MSDNENDLSDMHVNENDDLLNEEIEAGGDGDEEIDAASDASLDIIKAKFKEMQDEAEKIRQMQTDMAKEMNISTTSSSGGGNSNQQLNLSVEEKMEIDSRSIYVGNVDYGATAEELEAHFHGCGSVNRVTIQIDKYSGQPKGFAYIEFADKDSVQTAIALDDSLFRGRQIKVSMKRTNRPGISSTNRPPRGRGIRGARVIIKYIYPGSRRPRGYPSRRRNLYSPY